MDSVDTSSTPQNYTATITEITVPINNGNFTMGRTTGNRSSNSLLNLALAAFYLNLTVQNANGSQFYQVGPVMPIALPSFDAAPLPWPESLGRYAQLGSQGYQNYGDNYKGAAGYRDGNGYYDDLMSSKNAYDIGKAYGGGVDYSKGSVVGGGFRDLNGRNKGHQAAGFSTSYRKDESGDRSTYYDDGLGHNAKVNYAAQDGRYRDQGGALRRGGYHDTNLNRNAIGNTGSYGDSYTYKGFNGGSRGSSGGGGFGLDKNYGNYYSYPTTKGFSGYPLGKGYGSSYHRHGRLLPASLPNGQLLPPPIPGTIVKETGIYVIPMPEKLFIDPTPEM